MEERIIELETKVAFQDEIIETLNQTVIQQQRVLDQLRLELKEVKTQVEARLEMGSSQTVELPPHY